MSHKNRRKAGMKSKWDNGQDNVPGGTGQDNSLGCPVLCPVVQKGSTL